MFFGGGFPFEQMGGMGGGPRPKVDTESLYKELGVEKTATSEDIKKAFRKLAIKHHPDKGGDQEKFKELCKAYEILSDPEKRRNYDEFGEDGVETGGQPAGEGIFEMFFGGGNSRRRGQPRSDDVHNKAAFTLEEFFKGATKKMAITHNVICSKCEGRGGPADAVETCSECNGQGVKVVYSRMGPMIRQSQSACGACRSSGKRIAANKECKSCSGSGVTRERKTIELHLPRGAPEGHRVVFKGDADQVPGELPGDIIFTCLQKPHDVFERKGASLSITREITLKEALCGSGFFLKTLDGEQKWIDYTGRAPITPGTILGVENEGMPKGGSMFVRGNLFIKFDVKFPGELSGVTKKQLATLLPGPEPRGPPEEKAGSIEVLAVTYIDPKATGPDEGEEGEEDDNMPQNVQCRQG